MTNIAAYLIAAPPRHSRHIFNSDPDESFSESRSTIKTRVTQHYTAALLAYGFPTSEPELSRATSWFATPFPDGKNNVLDTIEMTRLEGLLNLQPDDVTVKPRLIQLLAQRNQHYFEIDRMDGQGPPAQVFDTLWSLKLLMLARQKGVIDGLIQDKEIQQYIDHIEKVIIEDKDRALLLRLQYDLNNKLQSHQEDYLKELIERADSYGGLWGITQPNRWKRVKDIVETMHKQQLTPGILDDQVRSFREIILSTCYVIENLADLIPDYPYLLEPITRSMKLWWRQFQGGRAPSILRALLPDDYDYLMVMCRTMVAVSAYVGEPLGARCWMPSLRETSRKFGSNDWPEMESIEEALRKWIGIEITEPNRLKLGLSGADVIRIKPHMYNPTDEAHTDMLRQSLVVKYGPAREIEKERLNYSELPASLRSYFVSIPDASYVNEAGQAFVIMQDLSDYYTLFEIFDRLLKPDPPRLPQLLARFLMVMHQGENDGHFISNNNHLRDIYLLPMLHHVDTLLNVAETMRRRDLLAEDQPKKFEDAEKELSLLLGTVMQNQRKIGEFPLSYMHGDLHSRNIMIRRVERPRSSRSGPELEFKLIDLESLRANGDAAHDAGQLLVDLNLIPINNKRSVSRPVIEKLKLLGQDLETAYLDFAEERNDPSFPVRLDLARARSMLRIAKSHAKRSMQYLSDREDQRAIDSITEGLSLAESATLHLRKVHDALHL